MSGGVALLSSCSNDKLDEPEPEPTDVQGEDNNDTIYIDIMTDDVTSRAGESESDVVGTTEENYFDPATIHLYPYCDTGSGSPSWVLNWDGFLREELEQKEVRKISGGYRIYLDRGYLQGCCYASNYPQCVIVAIANWGSIIPTQEQYKGDPMQLVAAQSTLFTYSAAPTDDSETRDASVYYSDYTPSTTQAIPMYGALVAQRTDVYNDSFTNLGTLYLYRALAKIIVKVPTDLQSRFEEKITLNKCYTAGTRGPINLAVGNNPHVISTATTSGVYKNLDSNHINIPGELKTANFSWSQKSVDLSDTPSTIGSVPFNIIKTDDDYKWYQLYVPEFRIKETAVTTGNSKNTYTPAAVDNYIEFTDKSGNKWKIAFENSKEETFDIIRNHIYVFEVTGIKSTLSLKYTVVDWDERVSGDIHFD
jgi:hypothetical protein